MTVSGPRVTYRKLVKHLYTAGIGGLAAAGAVLAVRAVSTWTLPTSTDLLSAASIGVSVFLAVAVVLQVLSHLQYKYPEYFQGGKE
jgi:hypothetical protein